MPHLLLIAGMAAVIYTAPSALPAAFRPPAATGFKRFLFYPYTALGALIIPGVIEASPAVLRPWPDWRQLR